MQSEQTASITVNIVSKPWVNEGPNTTTIFLPPLGEETPSSIVVTFARRVTGS